MTLLREHLAGSRHADFAARLGISCGFLSEIVHQKKQPGLHLAVRIERETNGDVPVESWPQFAVLLDRHSKDTPDFSQDNHGGAE